MTKFRYILFDLDGTLTDSREGICKSVQFALRQQGIHEPDLKKCEPFIGPPLKNSFMEFYDMTEEEALQAIADYHARYLPIGLFENKVYPGIVELLQFLKARGCHLGIASSKPKELIERILRHFALDPYFEVIAGPSMKDHGESKAEMIRSAMEQLGAIREETIMVGDRKFDALGARENGIPCIGVRYGFAAKQELELAGATYLVKDVKALTRLLQSGNPDPWRNKSQEFSREEMVREDGRDAPDRSRAREGHIFADIGGIVTPVLLYMVVTFMSGSILMVLFRLAESYPGVGKFLSEHSRETAFAMSGVPKILGALALIPMLRAEKLSWRGKMPSAIVTILLMFVGLSLFLNILISQMQLYAVSRAYMETAQKQYAVPIWQGIVLYGILSPVAEEALFRGLVYNRMKKVFPQAVAMLLSAAFFGVYHMNLVQGIYGFLMGLAIAYVYEQTGDLKIAVAAHGVANIVVFLMTYQENVAYALASPLNAVLLAFVAISSFLNLRRHQIRQ